MRIIHNIGPKRSVQIGLSGNAYIGKVGTEHEWQGWRAELLIASRDCLSGAEQAIEIEGTGSDIMHALEQALNTMKGYEQLLREEHSKGHPAPKTYDMVISGDE